MKRYPGRLATPPSREHIFEVLNIVGHVAAFAGVVGVSSELAACHDARPADVPRTRAMHATSGHGRLVSPPSGEIRLITLPDGVVLATGNETDLVLTSSDAPDGAYFSTCDADRDRWLSAGRPAMTGMQGSASVLVDGRVLLAGGLVEAHCPPSSDGLEPAHVERCFVGLARVEVWSPARRTFEPAAPLARPRFGHAGLRLDDGRVLVMGGKSFAGVPTVGGVPRGEPMASAVSLQACEVYDSKTDRWAAAAPMHAPRGEVAAMKLDDGRVLVAGDGGAEIFAPRENTWASLPGTPAWQRPVLVVLSPGRVLGVGKLAGEGRVKAAILDVGTPTWSDASGLTTDKVPIAVVRLKAPDPRVAVFSASSVILWDPERGTSEEKPLTQVRDAGDAVLLPDGRVLVAGGASYTRSCPDVNCSNFPSPSPPEFWAPPPRL